jgi:hypothetical protein
VKRLVARFRAVQGGTWVVVGVFAVVRATYFLTGGGMATSFLQGSWQLLDLKQLRADPFGSVALLHIQPPLFNLFVGSVERWGPIDPGGVYKVLYLLCGLVLVVSLRALLHELGWSPLAATIGAAVVATSPVLLSYENTITYELPVATALVLAGLWCVRYATTRSTKALVILGAVLTFATMTRALLHPLWLLAVLGFVVVVARPAGGWRAVVAGFAIPVVLVGGWMVKNEVLFGEPSLSSWLGDNLARGVIAPMPKHEIQRLVRDGTLTHAALVRGFAPYSAYRPQIGKCRTDWTEPVLRRLTKHNGQSNFNAICFLRVYHQEQDNSIRALRELPADYVGTRYAPAAVHFTQETAPGVEQFADTWTFDFLDSVWAPVLLRTNVTIHDRGWAVPLIGFLRTKPTVHPALGLVAATIFVLGLGALAATRVLRRRGRPSDVAMTVLGGTVLFVLVVSVGTEFGENARFRVLVDPIVIGITVAAITDGVRRLVTRRREARDPDEARQTAA